MLDMSGSMTDIRKDPSSYVRKSFGVIGHRGPVDLTDTGSLKELFRNFLEKEEVTVEYDLVRLEEEPSVPRYGVREARRHGSVGRMETVEHYSYTGPRKVHVVTAAEQPVVDELVRLCKERGVEPRALTAAQLDVLVRLVVNHDWSRVPGLEGCAARLLAASVASLPGLTARHLTSLLGVTGTTSRTCAGDGDVIRKVLAHPSADLSHLLEVLTATGRDRVLAWTVSEHVDRFGRAGAKMLYLAKQVRLNPDFFREHRALALIAAGGDPLVEVYETLRSDAEANEYDMKRVVELLELASLTLS